MEYGIHSPPRYLITITMDASDLKKKKEKRKTGNEHHNRNTYPNVCLQQKWPHMSTFQRAKMEIFAFGFNKISDALQMK